MTTETATFLLRSLLCCRRPTRSADALGNAEAAVELVITE
jgi:hypothetical protein